MIGIKERGNRMCKQCRGKGLGGKGSEENRERKGQECDYVLTECGVMWRTKKGDVGGFKGIPGRKEERGEWRKERAREIGIER